MFILFCVPSRHNIFLIKQSPLSTALCPSSNCHAVSHLKCLSQHFIDQQDQPKTMVPRGGHCKSCKEYVLWGDVIRGCYRRMRSYSPTGQLSDDMEIQENKSSLRKKKNAQDSISTPKPRRSRKSLGNLVTSEDNAISMKRKPGRPRKDPEILSSGALSLVPSSHPLTSSENKDKDTTTKRKPGRPRKDPAIAIASPSVSSSRPLKASRKPKKSTS